MNDQIPLYIGIPLALLCLAVVAVVLGLGFVIWKDQRRSK